MQLIYLLISILYLIGFDYIGKKTSNILNFDQTISKISDPIYQNSLIGIVFFIFFFFPIFFLGFFNHLFFISISLIILMFGILNLINNYSLLIDFFLKIDFSFKKKNLIYFIFIFLIILYFLLSISPITSGDSVAYHLSTAKYIVENGKFPSTFYDSTNSLGGAGEFLSAFALSIKAFQFTSIINFVGTISIIGVIKKFSENLNLDDENKVFLYLCILSCPVLIFLTSTSKSQLFSTSLIFFSYAILFLSINNNFKSTQLIKNFIICNIFCVVAVQTKISFSLSFFLIIVSFLFINRKKNNFYNLITIFIILTSVGLLPYAFWKQNIYEYPFYNFFFNPFPLNIPGYADAFLSAKNYFVKGFPLSIFIPLSLSDLTQPLGVGCFLLFFLIYYKFNNKNILLLIIFSFIIIYSYFGQKTPRFYLEIYFLLVLFICGIINNIHKTYSFKIFKLTILFQSIFVLCVLIVGNISLLPGIFSEKLNKKVLSRHASGYNLYDWVNVVLPENSKLLTNHRSTYFLNNEAIFFEMAYHSDNLDKNGKIYFLEKIKQEEPNFILFYGFEKNYKFNSYDFYNCTNGMFSKKLKAGFRETRNIFNSTHKYYDAYIYHFDYSKLPKCVEFD